MFNKMLNCIDKDVDFFLATNSDFQIPISLGIKDYNVSKFYNVRLQRYREKKICICGKHSVPLKICVKFRKFEIERNFNYNPNRVDLRYFKL